MRFIDHSPFYYDHSFFWVGGLLSIVINILLWGAIIWLIVKLVKHLSGTSTHSCCGTHGTCCVEDEEDGEDTNKYLDIIKMRYAKGEIDKKHFDELKKEFSPHKEKVVEMEKEENNEE